MKWLEAYYWLCRILAAISILIILLFFIGEGFSGHGIKADEWLLFLCFPLGVVAGLVTGFRNSSWGGRIAVLSIGAFYLIHHQLTGEPPKGWAFILFSLPGFLFLVHGMLQRSLSGRQPKPEQD